MQEKDGGKGSAQSCCRTEWRERDAQGRDLAVARSLGLLLALCRLGLDLDDDAHRVAQPDANELAEGVAHRRREEAGAALLGEVVEQAREGRGEAEVEQSVSIVQRESTKCSSARSRQEGGRRIPRRGGRGRTGQPRP